MYGYLPRELIGQPTGSLVPDGLRARTSAARRIRLASNCLPGCQEDEDIQGRMRAGRH